MTLKKSSLSKQFSEHFFYEKVLCTVLRLRIFGLFSASVQFQVGFKQMITDVVIYLFVHDVAN